MTARRFANRRTHRAIVATTRGFDSRSGLRYTTADTSMEREQERQQCDQPLVHKSQNNPMSHSWQQ